MKIKTVQTQCGIVNYVEVAGIDMSKDKTHYVQFHPERMSFHKYPGEDSRLANIKDRTDIDDKEDYQYFYNSIFSLPLEEFNLDWHIVNKDFEPENSHLKEMKKQKQCPIVVDNTSFMQWFVKIYPYLNDEWKAQNTDYVTMMEQRMLTNNQNMLEGFKEQDMKAIRSAVKLGADINFEENAQSALGYSVEHKNTDLMKYLINKKVFVPQGFAMNEVAQDIFSSYLKKAKTMNIIRKSHRG